MGEVKEVPVCPYCGAKMIEAGNIAIWYKPNHVLSFEELVSMAKEEPDGFPVWVEYNPRKAAFYERGFSGWRILIKIHTWSNNDRTLMFNDDETVGYKNLGVAVRCWLRKPTPDLMGRIPWVSSFYEPQEEE